MPLLSPKDIETIFSSGYLYEKASFFIIDRSTKTYRTDFHGESFQQRATALKEAYLSGHTIIVKNLEDFNSKIFAKVLELGRGTDVHMYLTPRDGGISFDFHVDDCDVLLKVIFGEKIFEIKSHNEIVTRHILGIGDEFFLKGGTVHRAIASGVSCLLSFGSGKILDYKIPGSIDLKDLHQPSPKEI